MNLNKSHAIFLIIATLFLGLTYLPLLASEPIVDAFAREDGAFENLTAVYLLVTAFAFAASFFLFREASWLLKLAHAGLAIFFFLGAAEEISWGERIFEWEDHNFVRGINVQRELTIHNLKYFQGDEAILPVSIAQLFFLFCFAFAVLIPLIARLFPRIRMFLEPIFPIMPLPFGLLVVATYIFQKAMVRLLPMFPGLYQHSSMPIPQGVHEIREHGYSFALMVSAMFYVLEGKAARDRESKKTEEERSSSTSPVN
jgi:hypothetical protein